MKTNKPLIVLILLLIFSCKGLNEKTSIGFSKVKDSEVEIFEIKKSLSDTISVKLDSVQIKYVLDLINKSGHQQLLKAMPKYWLLIKLKNDSIKKYKISDNYFGENDLYVRMKDKDYLKSIYENNIKSNSLIESRIK